MKKKIRGIGIAAHKVDLGMVQEIWADGKPHDVRSFKGVDRKVWIRFWPRPCLGIGSRKFPARKGK